MDSLLTTNLKSLIILVHLAGLALGIGGAWILDLYIFRKLYNSPITKESVQIIVFVSEVVTIGLVMLWLSGIAFIVFYSLVEPESLLNQKIWAKVCIVLALSINGYYLHKVVIPIIVNNQGKVLMQAISLRQINMLALVGCISFVSWPMVMFLGTFKSINFTFSFFEIIGFYLIVLALSLLVSFTVKSYLIEKEMHRKLEELNEHLRLSKQKLDVQTREIKVLTNVLKQN